MNGPTELEIMGIVLLLIAVIGGISISESDRITGERLDKFSHLKQSKKSDRLSPESHPKPDSDNLPCENKRDGKQHNSLKGTKQDSTEV